MSAIARGKRRSQTDEPVPFALITHSQALWTLREIGLADGSSPSTFAHYVKALRKLGIPIEKGTHSTRREGARYGYEPMMELAVALALRVYGTLPDSIPTALKRHRERLYLIYRQAISARPSDPGRPSVRIDGLTATEISGVYLELGLAFEKGRIVEAGVPAALSAREAVERFALCDAAARSWLPASRAPRARRGAIAAESARPSAARRRSLRS
jgi:hypothetical protein